MPTFFVDLRRDVCYEAQIEIEAADEQTAIKLANEQVEIQQPIGWPDKRERNRERAKDRRDRQRYPEWAVKAPAYPDEAALIPIDWNVVEDNAIACAATNYGPDGNTMPVSRKPSRGQLEILARAYLDLRVIIHEFRSNHPTVGKAEFYEQLGAYLRDQQEHLLVREWPLFQAVLDLVADWDMPALN